MVSEIFLGLGSNKGDRKKFISMAIDAVEKNKECRLIKLSSLYETAPLGFTEQENFYNVVLKIETGLEIEELYEFVKHVELNVGREKDGLRWGPREIDVDILFYNNLIYNSDKLTVPHKEILNRDFVIVPLIEIARDYVHPVLMKKLSDLDISNIEKHIIRKIDFATNR